MVPLVREIDTADLCFAALLAWPRACFKAGLRRGAKAEGTAGTRDLCWEHVGRVGIGKMRAF